ncbi:MAG TPA: lysophospholipid acyltransferase family protein [Cellulomonas sp.]
MAHPARANGAYRMVAAVVRPFLRATTRRDWRGTDNLRREGGFIAAANHATELDPLTFAHMLYDQGIAPRILAKASLFKVPLLGGILRSTGQLPVDRGTTRAADSLEPAVRALAAGEVVAVFPEGTLTRDPDLWPMAGKTGVARLALASRAAVVPVAQWGATELLPRYSKRLRPFPRKQVHVLVGRPVPLDDLYDRPRDAAVLREATDRVLDAITELLEQIRGEQAPRPRFDLRDHPDYQVRQTVYPPVPGR